MHNNYQQDNNCKCKNLLSQKERHIVNFANSVYDEFRKMKYGIQSCRRTTELYIAQMRKDLIDYHINDDINNALCEVSIREMSSLPFYYPTSDECCEH